MSKIERQTPPNEEITQHQVFVSQNIGANNMLFTVLGIYLAITTGTWQAYGVILLAIEAVLGGFISASLFRRKRVNQASWMLLITNCIAPATAAWIVADFSWVSIAYIVVSTYFIYNYATPNESRRKALVVIVVALSISFIAGIVKPAWQLSSKAMVTIAPIFIGILGVAFVITLLIRAFSGSIRARLLTTFIILAALPVLVTGVVSVLITSQNARSEVLGEVAAIGQLKANQVNAWISTLQIDLGSIMQDKTTLIHTGMVIGNSPGIDTAKTSLRKKFNEINKSAGYFEELFILDKNGVILLSTNESQEGKIAKTQSYFHEGIQSPYVAPPTYDVALSDYSILFARPIQNNSGVTIGVLAGRANLAVLDKIMTENVGLGTTNETYLIGENYALLTKSRFKDVKAGELYIRTSGTTNVIESKTAGTSSYNDYRDTPVLGAYLWVPDLKVAVLSEQDEIEALKGSNQAFATTVGLIILSVVLAAIAAFLVTRTIANPISELVTVAESASAGNLEITAVVQREDEVGALATAFNTMTRRLRELIGTLEQRVVDRTKALATTSEVSRRLSTILDQKELVTEVVNQVNNAFGYYHTQIYFYDADNENLVMAGGTGEAGEKMLAQFHKVAKGRGLVGSAAENNEPVLVSDTSENSDWLPNLLLPETESEMAIPISIGDQVLGVLDVQHNVKNGLQQEDVVSLQSIANQVAIATQNIRQYQNTQKIASDMSVVATVGIATATITDSQKLLQEVVDLSKKSFNLYHAHIYLMNEAGDTLELTAGADEVGRQMVSEKRVISLDSEQSLVARAARSKSGVVVNDVSIDPNFLPNPLLPDTRSEMAVPMIVAGKVIGVLDVQSETINRFTDVDVNIKTTLATQVAVALQNAHSFAQTQQQAKRETSVNTIVQKIQSATKIENALQIAARELGHALGMKPTRVTLEPESLDGERKGNTDE